MTTLISALTILIIAYLLYYIHKIKKHDYWYNEYRSQCRETAIADKRLAELDSDLYDANRIIDMQKNH